MFLESLGCVVYRTQQFGQIFSFLEKSISPPFFFFFENIFFFENKILDLTNQLSSQAHVTWEDY